MKVIIFGPPGSGKGTQALLLEKNFKFFRLSPGDILRDKSLMLSMLNSECLNVMNTGGLVDDDIIFKIVKASLCYEKILFDGYPRTLNQASFLIKNNVSIDLVINMTLSVDCLLKRIKYRIINAKYFFIYNILNKKSFKIRYKDDLTGLFFSKRYDDKYNIFIKRLFEYEKHLSLIIDYYIKNNINIVDINAENQIASVYSVIKKTIDNFYAKKY